MPIDQTYPPDSQTTLEDSLSGACGRDQPSILSNSSFGRIFSPNYPGDYPSNIDCSWVIQVEAGSVVRLSFGRFELEPESDCEYVY